MVKRQKTTKKIAEMNVLRRRIPYPMKMYSAIRGCMITVFFAIWRCSEYHHLASTHKHEHIFHFSLQRSTSSDGILDSVMVYSIYTIFAVGHPHVFRDCNLQPLKFDCIAEDYTVMDGKQTKL